VLARKREVARIAADVSEMRQMIEDEKPPANIWDVKLIPGGLVDIEFMAQYLTLVAPARGLETAGHVPGTDATLAHFGPKEMDNADVDTVRAALKLYSDFAQIVRLCIDGGFDPKEAPDGLKELLCQIGEVPDLKVLESEIKRFSQSVRKIFRRTVGTAPKTRS
jgi:glutamate-ammonia-ligase adenylyltransferase